jgi:hypothetical protein
MWIILRIKPGRRTRTTSSYRWLIVWYSEKTTPGVRATIWSRTPKRAGAHVLTDSVTSCLAHAASPSESGGCGGCR